MTAKRKLWRKPSLIILARSDSAESVLTNCKYFSGSVTSRNARQSRCLRNSCAACSTQVRS